MIKKISFDSIGNPNFDINGEYSTELNTNLIHRFYLQDGEMKDKYSGMSDEEITDKEQEDHLKLMADQAVTDAAAIAALVE
jgi:hypothetical protein